MTRSPSGRPAFAPRVQPRIDATVLVLFCHPAPHKSRVNAALADAVRDLPFVTFHDLYEAYPDHLIDVAFEQGLLLMHHTVVFQHPFYWYSTPALLKDWQDHVLEYGWAYGKNGVHVRGRRLLSAITTGGPHESYTPDGMHGITVSELLAPIRQTARLCGMPYLDPFVVHGTHKLTDAAVAEAARNYRARLESLKERP